MKWPTELTIVRHAQSAYNILRDSKNRDPLYKKFVTAYNQRFGHEETKAMAHILLVKYGLGVSDADTPITARGVVMAKKTGEALQHEISLPDVVFISPYIRTGATWDNMVEGWPALSQIPPVYEDRIREQEHGLSLLYNDWRIFHVMHPEQKILRGLQGPYWYQYPQGESVSNVRDRIRSFLGTLVREYSEKRVMLITHHLTILSMRATLERWSPAKFIQMDEEEKPVNCGVTIYHGKPNLGSDGRLVLTAYNKKFY